MSVIPCFTFFLNEKPIILFFLKMTGNCIVATDVNK